MSFFLRRYGDYGFFGFSYRKALPRFYVLAIALLGALIGVRWYHAGHPPIFGTYEETLSASFAVTLFSLILDRGGRFARFTASFAFFYASLREFLRLVP